MSNRFRDDTTYPTFDEMQALMREARAERTRTIAEFFGIGFAATQNDGAKQKNKRHDEPALVPGTAMAR